MEGVTILNSYEYLTNSANIVGSIIYSQVFLRPQLLYLLHYLTINLEDLGWNMPFLLSQQH